jgi:site-specific recombinase XerD
VNEAASLKVGDIDFEGRLMVVRGKFDRDRMVPVSEVARDFLVRYLGDKIEHNEAWVFVGSRGSTKGGHLRSTSISERFRLRLREFGMDKPEISTHSIRHSTATHLLENGASIRHVQELLGHRSIESTVRYTHVMTDSLAKIYRRHHPREHELYEEVDEDYEARLSRLAGGHGPG